MFGQFFVLFATMAAGYVCSAKKWITPEANKGLGNLVLFITMPCMLFVSMAYTEIAHTMLLNFFIIVVMQVIYLLVVGRLLRFGYRKAGYREDYLDMIEITTATVNCGFIGLPIGLMFFGETGLLYMSAATMGLNLYLWSCGLYIIKGETGEGVGKMLISLGKGAINPNTMSITVGIVAGLLGLTKFIPDFIESFLRSMGSVSTPLSLVYIGALAGGGIATLFKEKDVVVASLLRVAVIPAATLVVLFILPLDTMVKAIFFVNAGMPSAAVVPMMVGKYGKGEGTSSKIVLLSTVLSLITLPLCVTIANWMLNA